MPPTFIEIPDRVVKVPADSVASIPCQEFGFPPPKVVWTRGLVPLPHGRTTAADDTLNISNFSPEDVGPYQCKATNKPGSVSALATLRYFVEGENKSFFFFLALPFQ